MVSNYDRIYAEINSEARRLAAEQNIDPNSLVSLTMAIVDLADQRRTKHIPRIKQIIEEKIFAAAVNQMQNEGS